MRLHSHILFSSLSLSLFLFVGKFLLNAANCFKLFTLEALCSKAREILVEECNVQRVDAPVTVGFPSAVTTATFLNAAFGVFWIGGRRGIRYTVHH